MIERLRRGMLGDMGNAVSYVSVLHWPDGWGEHARQEALAGALGIDPLYAAGLARATPPQVAARLDPVAAAAAAEALARRGVGVLETPHQRLADRPPPVRAKRLVPTAGGLAVEPWRGPMVPLAAAEIWLMIRGKLVKRRPTGVWGGGSAWRADPRDGAIVDAIDDDPWGGLLGPSGMGGASNVVMREVIELHFRDGQRVRIDGSKFNFDVLGAGRGLSDHANADLLAVRLAEGSPRAIVDLGFAAFRPAAWVLGTLPVGRGVDRQRFPDDDPAFEFYSVWIAEVYRHLAGGAGEPDETGAA